MSDATTAQDGAAEPRAAAPDDPAAEQAGATSVRAAEGRTTPVELLWDLVSSSQSLMAALCVGEALTARAVEPQVASSIWPR